LIALGCAAPAQAQDFVESAGPLDDAAFYRLVACAAPPGGPCGKPIYRWETSQITVGITQRDPAFLGGKLKRAEAAVIRALQRSNAVGMGITLTRSEAAPGISIHLLDRARGEVIAGSDALILNGLALANATTALNVKGGTISGAAIGFSTTLPIRHYESVMLEEITQALGLITDIANPYSESRSILSQTADNSLKTLGIQDRMALIRNYPPG
jgi:hypothetical protein